MFNMNLAKCFGFLKVIANHQNVHENISLHIIALLEKFGKQTYDHQICDFEI